MLINDSIVVSQLAAITNGAWIEPAQQASGQDSVITVVKVTAEIAGAALVVLMGKAMARKKNVIKG